MCASACFAARSGAGPAHRLPPRGRPARAGPGGSGPRDGAALRVEELGASCQRRKPRSAPTATRARSQERLGQPLAVPGRSPGPEPAASARTTSGRVKVETWRVSPRARQLLHQELEPPHIGLRRRRALQDVCELARRSRGPRPGSATRPADDGAGAPPALTRRVASAATSARRRLWGARAGEGRLDLRPPAAEGAHHLPRDALEVCHAAAHRAPLHAEAMGSRWRSSA